MVGGDDAALVRRFVAQACVAQEEGDQTRFQGDAGEFGGAGDGFPQFRHGHGGQYEQSLGEDGGQPGQFEAASGEVGADAEHDDRRVRAGGERAQDPDECPSLVLVGAEGEKFLELVDEQHGPHRWRAAAVGARRSVVRAGTDGVQQALGAVGQPGRGEVEIAAEGLRGPFEEFVHGVGGGREGDHGPAVGARHREAAGAPQRRDQTGVQQGGLAGCPTGQPATAVRRRRVGRPARPARPWPAPGRRTRPRPAG